MVSIFVRRITGDLASLVKQIDDAVARHEDQRLAAFVVLLTDDQAGAENKLKKLAEERAITFNTPLTVFGDSRGPASYDLSPKAEVTVMMWKGIHSEVKLNRAFARGELNSAAIPPLVADIEKLLLK